jgi:hypothetical protein
MDLKVLGMTIFRGGSPPEHEIRESFERERKNAKMLAFFSLCRTTLENRFQSPNPLGREKARVLSKLYACPCYFSMLLVHATCPFCVSLLNFCALCPYCMSMLRVHAACACCVSMLHVHAAGPCFHAACPCMSMLRVHAAYTCGKSVLNVHASCLLCISMLYICPCCMSILHVDVYAACPSCMSMFTSMLHVHASCPFSMSMPHI